MSEYSQLEVDFIKRTLHLLESYRGKYEVTMLINCSLGLLVFPKEIMHKSRLGNLLREHDVPVKDLDTSWGIQRLNVSKVGKEYRSSKREYTEDEFTASELTKHLRHALAHGNFQTTNPGAVGNDIEALNFTDGTGFDATISVEDLRTFAVKLARTILSNIEPAQAKPF